jgi:hydroxymethylpyrimidine pyrophosphatase-like HAD family hydrolase
MGTVRIQQHAKLKFEPKGHIMFSDILLTVDYDRTLTAPDSTIPARNMEAIEYFIANGGAFTINTGRSLPMAGTFLGKVPVSAPLLLYNGSGAYDPRSGRFTQTFPLDLDPDAFIAELQQLFPDLLVEIQAVGAHYLTRPDRDWEIFSENGGCAWGYCAPGQIPGPFLKVSLYGDCSGHCVASMYQATDAELQRMREAIHTVQQLYGDRVEVFWPCAKIVDIHAKGVNKCRAARTLQQTMGRKYLICVGDAENDVTMLQGADYAFCPADGVVADRFPNVCECGKGAVAEVIYEKIPAILKNKA